MTYTSKDIKILTDREHVRLRTSMYLGNTTEMTFELPDVINPTIDRNTFSDTFVPATFKAVGEIIDNSIDEFAQINKKSKELQIECNAAVGEYKIADNGRGVPIDKHESGSYTPEVVFGSLRSGRNFVDEKSKGVQGMNGVGSAITNFLSEYFTVEVTRGKKHYIQTFKNGAKTSTAPKISDTSSTKTGTTISFKLDPTTLHNTTLSDEVIKQRAHYIAVMNPGVTVTLNGEKIQYKKGLVEVVQKVSSNYFTVDVETDRVSGTIYIIATDVEQTDNNVFTWVNSSYLLDGGLCNTQITNAFTKQVADHLKTAARRKGGDISQPYVRRRFIAYVDLKISDPSFDNQAKTKLTGPDIRREITDAISDDWAKFVRSNGDWLDDILTASVADVKSKEDKQAIKDLEDRIKRRVRPETLIEATSTKRAECRLLIVEGLSAKSSIQEARDPAITAAIAMSGKFNNVYSSTPAQVINMGKMADLLATIGLIPGKPADKSKLRYGKVVIAVDADYDGQDIFCNFINLFYKFWPNLLDPDETPYIYKLIVPNVVASKGDKRVHFKSRHDYEKVSTKFKTWDIEYMKGLGSMKMEDWEVVLNDESYELPVVSDDALADTLELLFGPNADNRKKWLEC